MLRMRPHAVSAFHTLPVQPPLAQDRHELIHDHIQPIDQPIRLQVEAVDGARVEPVLDVVGQLLGRADETGVAGAGVARLLEVKGHRPFGPDSHPAPSCAGLRLKLPCQAYGPNVQEYTMLSRRHFVGSSLGTRLVKGLGIGLLGAQLPSHAVEMAPEAALRAGGAVLVVRHALAPGTFDPPGFRLGECSTQRNLSEEGRDQARRMGAWFRARALQPARVRTSPWCRCMDTANLAFERSDVWPALGSPQGAPDSTKGAHLQALRLAVATASAQKGQFEVWVTHMFVIADLVDTSIGSGEGVVLRAGTDGVPQVLARFPTV